MKEITDNEKNSIGMGKKRSIPFVYDVDWDAFCAVKRQYNLKWRDVFARFTAYRNGIEYIFSAPPKLTNQIKLDLNTVMGLATMWIDNTSKNFLDLRYPDVTELFNLDEFTGKPAITIAAGPSLHRNKHLEQLKDSNFQKNGGKVFTCAHSLADVLHAGIVPDVCSIVDGHNLMLQYFKDPLIDEYADQIKMIFIASTDPEVFTNWKGEDRYLFHSGVPDFIIPNIDLFLSTMLRGLSSVNTGGNSGSANFVFASLAGCNPVATIGFDLSYPEDFPYDRTQYYEAYKKSVGSTYKDEDDMINKCYRAYAGVHPDWKNKYYFDFVNDVFIKSFKEIVTHIHTTYDTKCVNCTEGGAVFGDNITCMSLEKYLDENGGG